MTTSNDCSLCEAGIENDWHLFFGCNHARAIWQASGFWSVIATKVDANEGIK